MKFGINNPAWLQAAGNIGGEVANPFYIQAIEDETTVTFLDPIRQFVRISLNRASNYELAPESIVISATDKLYITVDTITEQPETGGWIVAFNTDKEYDVFGTALLFDIQVESNTFYRSLSFLGTKVRNASELVITPPIYDLQYSFLFKDCTSLVLPPALPALELTDGCYYSMFSGCTSLTTSPELPAKILTDGCYVNMFAGCTLLSNITCLAENFAEDSTANWLSNVAAQGTFVKAHGVEWPTGTSGIPDGWTVEEYAG